MIQTSSSTLLDRSRLVSLLTELSSTKLNSADYNLAERLGNLIGLSGSINLAQALRRPAAADSITTTHEKSLETYQLVEDKVLSARMRILRRVAEGFDHQLGAEDENSENYQDSSAEKDKQNQNKRSKTKLKVPTANVAIRPEALLSFEPYQRFYTTFQVEIGVEVQSLRNTVRQHILFVSPELLQLAQLDKTLEESLAVHNRKLFGVTPKLLERHFAELLSKRVVNTKNSDASNTDLEIQTWLKTGAWLNLFYKDMRELLLAEFDVRMQPVFGLLEALKEQTKKVS